MASVCAPAGPRALALRVTRGGSRRRTAHWLELKTSAVGPLSKGDIAEAGASLSADAVGVCGLPRMHWRRETVPTAVPQSPTGVVQGTTSVGVGAAVRWTAIPGPGATGFARPCLGTKTKKKRAGSSVLEFYTPAVFRQLFTGRVVSASLYKFPRPRVRKFIQ